MKKMTFLICFLAIAICGLQSVNAAEPAVSAPTPVNYTTEDPEDIDVLGFFGHYGVSAALSTPNWTQTPTWDYAETGDGGEVILISGLGTGIWLPVQFASPREIKKYQYLHIDIFCNEATDFRVGFHCNYHNAAPANFEEYLPLIKAADMTPGEWYSIEFSLAEFLARPEWGPNGNANLIRFGQNGENLEPAVYSNEIYVANMFVFNGTPTCLKEESGIHGAAVENAKIFVDRNAQLQSNQALECVTVYNVAGQQAAAFQANDNMNLSELPAGIYLVRALSADGKTLSQKIVK
ncbi:MAG: T9SS type A sorting domain-containing protein [Candidatus Symbiothrix sp.]|jgi:hypothetical protein|nr:T9SS type A sorting domain-containing protein [Candidatus Symbiothrix sp.]